MATKKQLAEQVLLRVNGGAPTQDIQIDIREIMLYVDQSRDNMASMSIFENVKTGEFDIDPEYLVEYPDRTLSTDTGRNLRYLDLPVSILSLPHEMGIYAIHPKQSVEETFIRISPGAMGLYTGLSSFNVEDKTYYWNTGQRVFFKNVDPMLTYVHMLLCPSSKEIAEDALFPIPPHLEHLIIAEAYKLFVTDKQIPHDEVSDGVK
jgi:hypothetical protein